MLFLITDTLNKNIYFWQNSDVRVHITRVVVHTDGYKGAMSEELDPITEELGRDEVTEPGGQLLTLPHHGGDVGQACQGEQSNSNTIMLLILVWIQWKWYENNNIGYKKFESRLVFQAVIIDQMIN